MQLYDRLWLVTILDSVGEYKGISRLFAAMGLPRMHPVLALWAANKDREDCRKHDYFQLTSTKRKRAEDKIKKMKCGMLQEKKAKRSGTTYRSGIANTVPKEMDSDAMILTFDSIDTTK
jgi:hypothetical protein